MEKNIPHRTCDLCIFDQYFIREFVEIHKIQWNHTSLIGDRWVKLIEKEAYILLPINSHLNYISKI